MINLSDVLKTPDYHGCEEIKAVMASLFILSEFHAFIWPVPISSDRNFA
jgi:hypothetical protein